MNEAKGNTGLARVVWRSALVLDGFLLFFMQCVAAANNSSGGEVVVWLLTAVITGLALWYVVKTGLWFEWKLQRIWKRTCAGLGGNFVAEKNDYLASVREGIRSRGQHYVATQKKVAYPELKNVIGDWQEWRAEVRFIDGQTIESYQRNAPAFALAYGVPFVNFDLAESGLIRIRAGELAIPQAFEFGQLELTDD